MNMSPIRRAAFATVLLAAAGVAQAHEAAVAHSHVGGFAAGFTHPLSGLDHLLAMLAVGLWSAAALPPSRRLVAPTLFMLTLFAGALLGLSFGAVPLTETGAALSVALFGLLLAGRARLPQAAGLGVTAVAGLLHGVAHGAEWVPGASFLAYVAGFMAASALLHGAGLSLGAHLATRGGWLWRAQAALFAAAGLFMLATRV
ncbi:HupE/UreJ family protein [Methyloversatilis thermotolerans]|uniref:HupE/UreJ family protein n=1 Tax=Methyloversatilis thermotolerans TaxID=1346290 RepID=UPI0003A3E0D7|nr:HupE/UreJ family protein [Methyloversatilis thermotolerans]